MPLVLPSLVQFIQQASLASDAVVNLCRSLLESNLFKRYRKVICAEFQFVAVRSRSGITWKLFPIDRPTIPLPPPPKSNPQRPWAVFSNLSKIEQEHGYTLVDADKPSLRPSQLMPQWDECLLVLLLDGVRTDIFEIPAQLEYFYTMLTSDGVRPLVGIESIQNQLRHILALAFAKYGEKLSRSEKLIQAIISLIKQEDRLEIPIVHNFLSSLYEAKIKVLLVPKIFDAPYNPSKAKLTREDATTLLWKLDRVLEKAKAGNITDAQKDCRKFIELVLSNLADHDRQTVLQKLKSLRLIEVHDCEQKQTCTVSLEELDEASNSVLLFRYSSGLQESEKVGLASLLQKAVKNKVFVLKSDMARLLYPSSSDIVSCTAEACLESLGRSVKDLRTEGVHALLERLIGADISSEAQVRGLRYLLHGKRGHFADTKMPLWVRGHDASSGWEKLWYQVLDQNNAGTNDCWNILRKELVDHIPQGKWDIIKIKEIKPLAILEEVKRLGTANLDGTKLSEEERNEIHAYTNDKQLWSDLPFHVTLAGDLVAVTDNTYLDCSLPLPPGLAELAIVLKKSDHHQVKLQQEQWLIPLDQQQIAGLALSHQNPQLFWKEVMSALTISTLPKQFEEIVRNTAWLPTRRGGAVSPRDVIFLPEIEDELTLLAAQEQDSYLPPSRLTEELQNAPGYEVLQSLFSAGEDALENLGLLLEDKQEYFLGEFPNEKEENTFQQHLEILSECPSNLGFPGWSLLQKLGVKHGYTLVAKHITHVMFQTVDGQRLVDLLVWVREKHEAGNKNEKNKIVATYNWALTAFANSPQAQFLLPRVFLLNKEEHWKKASELCTDVEGISGKFVLEDIQRDILRSIIVDASGHSVDNHLLTKESYKLPWQQLERNIKDTAPRLRDYFDQWQGQIAPETVCFFLCLLGGAPEIHGLANEWKGSHSLEWYRESIPWSIIPNTSDEFGRRRRLSGLSAEIAIRKHLFIVEITIGDKQVHTVSITDDDLLVSLDSMFTTLAVGGRPFYYQKMKDWPLSDNEVVRIRLRQPDQANTSPEQFSSALKKTAEYILANVYDQRSVNLNEFWAYLDKSGEQLNIRVAEALILENIPFYLKQLSVHKRQDQLKNILQAWDDTRHKIAEYQGNQARQNELQDRQRKCLRKLQEILKNDSDAQATVLDAVRSKVKDYQYEPASVPFELFQNADDATAEQAEIQAYPAQQSSDEILPDHCRRFLVLQDKNRLSFIHWGRPINSTGSGNFPGRERRYHQDMEKMLILSASDKESSKATGKFGLGFNSVLLVCDRPRVVSGRLGFEVVAGMCPVQLTSEDELRSRLFNYSVDKLKPGTLIDLPLVNEIAPNEVMDRFRKFATGLVVFSRQIRTIDVREHDENHISTTWSPSILVEEGSFRVELGAFLSPVKQEKRSALYFRCEKGGLFLGFGPRGFQKLPKEMPAIWVVAPTKEDSGLGIVLNGEFDLDAGRTKLSGTSEANLENAKNLGRAFAHGFVAFHEDIKKNWPEFIRRARLEADITPYEFWQSFWDVLTDAFSAEVTPARELIRQALTGDCGLGDFISSSYVLPTGLRDIYATLTNPCNVFWVLRGLLENDRNFSKAMDLPTFVEKAAPGQVVSEKIHRALCTVLPEYAQKRDQWASLRVQDIVAWVVGVDNQVTPQKASELGDFINKDLFENYGVKEIDDETKLLRAYLSTLLFQAESGDWVKNSSLLVHVDRDQGEGYEEERLRAEIAPNSRRLSHGYIGKAVDFFRLCRERMKASLEDMEAWIREAKEFERRSALLYLRDGEKRWDLLKNLRENGLHGVWLHELEAYSPYFEDWNEQDIDELLLRGLPPLDRLRDINELSTFSSKPKPFLHDPSTVLSGIHNWWNREWRTHLPGYEKRVYGWNTPNFSMDDETGRFDRSSWLTLFFLGALHTMGRSTPNQHRGFIELCKQRGWWLIFCSERPRERANEWMRILEEYFDHQIDSSEYEHWFKYFCSIYRFACYLDVYVEAFSSLNRSGNDDNIPRAILAPRSADIFQGGGIDAPPLDRTLGKGFCFVLRELKRKNILQHSRVSAWCFVPVGRVRSLLEYIGADISPHDSYVEQSKAIYTFMAKHLGPERACFMEHFDIPLQILAEKPDIQYNIFQDNIVLNDCEDEDAHPYLGMDIEEINS